MTVYLPKWELSSHPTAVPGSWLAVRWTFAWPQSQLGCSCPRYSFPMLQSAPSQLYQDTYFGEVRGHSVVPHSAELL